MKRTFGTSLAKFRDVPSFGITSLKSIPRHHTILILVLYNKMPPKTLKNFFMLETQVMNASEERTVQRIQNFFSQFLL
jgi:hypothetical protein